MNVVPPFIPKMVECGTSWECHAEDDGGWTITVRRYGAQDNANGSPDESKNDAPYAFWLGAEAA